MAIEQKSFSDEDIERFRGALGKLGQQAPRQGHNARLAVEAIAPDIRALMKAGHRLEDIFKALRADGFDCSMSTLTEYLHRAPKTRRTRRTHSQGGRSRSSKPNMPSPPAGGRRKAGRRGITNTKTGGLTAGDFMTPVDPSDV